MKTKRLHENRKIKDQATLKMKLVVSSMVSILVMVIGVNENNSSLPVHFPDVSACGDSSLGFWGD